VRLDIFPPGSSGFSSRVSAAYDMSTGPRCGSTEGMDAIMVADARVTARLVPTRQPRATDSEDACFPSPRVRFFRDFLKAK
jgi:hypothetical protein